MKNCMSFFDNGLSNNNYRKKNYSLDFFNKNNLHNLREIIIKIDSLTI